MGTGADDVIVELWLVGLLLLTEVTLVGPLVVLTEPPTYELYELEWAEERSSPKKLNASCSWREEATFEGSAGPEDVATT